ncbi:MAG TPA: right-handed parallel beta-helix repeat-containing protein [Candidatus Brocadiia bacterium]|nr:right-handed parallel beta-helix repeat-containing protein [Candidatus Brocadiia bacterium]
MRSFILFLIVLAISSTAPAGQQFFVSPGGNDAWSGKIADPNAEGTDGPFATLERARDAARRTLADTRKNGNPEGVTIFLRGGVHTLARTLVLEPQDSGIPEWPVVYMAYPGERPVVSGGRRITGWRKDRDNLWAADVPKGWCFTRMFVNGRLKTRARMPDTDNWGAWLKVAAGGPPEADAPEGMGSKIFKYPPGSIRNWDNSGDVEINCLPSYRYANFISPIASVDEANSTVTLASLAYYNFQPGDPFRIENSPDALDRPGEWRVDSTSGVVYYMPEPGEDMATAETIAPALHQLIRFQGNEGGGQFVRDIILRDLIFTHCDRRRWNEIPTADEANLHLLESAVLFEGTEHCGIEHCRFIDVAGFAARFNLAARGNRFVHNEVSGAGCGGLQMGGYGPGTKDVNKENIVTNNHIHHSSTECWHAGAIDLRQSGNNLIAFNVIHHMPYTGVAISGAHTGYFKQYRERGEGFGRAKYNFRWDEIPDDNPLSAMSVKPFLHGRNNIVEANVVYETLTRLPADGGALYGFGQGLGNVFRGNFVSRARCLAIYLDNEFDNVLVEGNLVVDSTAPFGGSGGTPVLRDNILCAPGQTTPELRAAFASALRLAEAGAGPWWCPSTCNHSPAIAPRTAARAFVVDFSALQEGDLPGQSGWDVFGPGGNVAVTQGTRSAGEEKNLVAAAAGLDTWAVIWHGIALDPAKDLLIQIDVRLPEQSEQNSSVEVYLNKGQIHADGAFGPGLVMGCEDDRKDAVGGRKDSAGARLLTTGKLVPGHWHRVRMVVNGGSGKARLYVRDLTAGEKEMRPLQFDDGASEASLIKADKWTPAWPELDALILRMGGGAQAQNLILQNPPDSTPE